MSRLLCTVGLILAATAIAAAPVPLVPFDPTKDREGNPLPKGAIARLGSLMYCGPNAFGALFSADSKRLLAHGGKEVLFGGKQVLFMWDTDTGKPMPKQLVPPPNLGRFPTVHPILRGDRVIWLARATGSPPFVSEVILCDLDGKVLSRFDVNGQPLFTPGQFNGRFEPTAITPDGRFLATILDEGWTVVVYDLNSGVRLLSQKFPQEKLAQLKPGQKDQPGLVLSPNGKTLFVQQKGKSIQRRELPSGKELASLEDSDSELDYLAESPGGKWIVTRNKIGLYKGNGKVEAIGFLVVRDGPTGKVVGRIDVGEHVGEFAYIDPNAIVARAGTTHHVAVGFSSSTVMYSRWNLSTLKREWEVPALGSGVVASSDGERFLSKGGRCIYLYDSATGKLVVEPRGHTNFIGFVAFSPDGRTVTTAGGGEVISWSISGDQKHRVEVPELRLGRILLPPTGAVQGDYLTWLGYSNNACLIPMMIGWDNEKNAIGWRVFVERPSWEWLSSPDGKRVVYVRPNLAEKVEVVTVHDGPTGEKLGEWSYPLVVKPSTHEWPKALSGDGRLLFVRGDEKTVLVFNATTGKEELRLLVETGDKRSASDALPRLAASSDGSRLAIFDRVTLQIYDVKSGKSLIRHSFPQGYRGAMKFSSDGKQLAVWRHFGSTVYVWNLDSDQTKPREIIAETWSEGTAVAFSPDNTKLAVGYADGTALIWDLTAK